MPEPGSLWERLLAVFFPPRCVLCDRLVEPSQLWCGSCACHPLPPHALEALEVSFPAVSAHLYRGGVRSAILNLKRRPDRRTARYLARTMAEALEQRYSRRDFDCIVPVPMSLRARESRGHSQTEVLARALADILDLPVLAGVLGRSDNTLSQHGLNRNQRRENALRSYHLRDGEAVREKSVLLLDDVLTTGATAAACISLLQGARQVVVLTAAATPLRAGGETE